MSGHRVEWTLVSGDYPRYRIICDEPESAKCRQYCVRCDECCECSDPITTVSATCVYVDWIENGDGEDYYGPPTKPVDGPVEVTWEAEGDGCSWRYVEPSI